MEHTRSCPMLKTGVKGEKNYISHTFKYHVSCTDGKISVRINLLFLHKPLQLKSYVRVEKL